MRAGLCLKVATASLMLVLSATTQAQAQSAPLLITPAELSRALGDPLLVILHVGPKDDYDAGHVPGARLVELSNISAPRLPDTPLLELPSDSALRATLESFGIGDKGSIVVVAGTNWVSQATRLIWTLDVAGLGARTRFLEGGSSGWKRAGLATTTDVPSAPKPGRITSSINRTLVVDHTWVQSRLNTSGFRLLDARTPQFYEGVGSTDGRGVKREAGHIPGARNIPYNTLFTDSLQFLPKSELRQRFASAGVQPGDTVVAYCHIGQQATVVLFAARLLGHPVKLYDGSFTEWESLKLPTENTKSGVPPTIR